MDLWPHDDTMMRSKRRGWKLWGKLASGPRVSPVREHWGLGFYGYLLLNISRKLLWSNSYKQHDLDIMCTVRCVHMFCMCESAGAHLCQSRLFMADFMFVDGRQLRQRVAVVGERSCQPRKLGPSCRNETLNTA